MFSSSKSKATGTGKHTRHSKKPSKNQSESETTSRVSCDYFTKKGPRCTKPPVKNSYWCEKHVGKASVAQQVWAGHDPDQMYSQGSEDVRAEIESWMSDEERQDASRNFAWGGQVEGLEARATALGLSTWGASASTGDSMPADQETAYQPGFGQADLDQLALQDQFRSHTWSAAAQEPDNQAEEGHGDD